MSLRADDPEASERAPATPALAAYPPIVGPEHYAFAAPPERWRLPVELVTALVVWGVLGALVYGALLLVAGATGVRETVTGFADPHLDLAFGMLAITVTLPAVWVAVRVPGRRSFGSVSSVADRLRWAWMRRCAVPALVCCALVVVGFVALESSLDPKLFPGALPYLGIVALSLLLVPLQAAAEEYLARGWLLQGLVPWVRRPWVAALPCSALFVALHGSADPERIVDLAVFAAALSWVTLRTGGLEAAIAFHVAFNLVLLVAGSLQGLPDLGEDQALSLPDLLATAVPTLLYAVWIDRRWRREIPPAPVGRPTAAAVPRTGRPDSAPTAAG